MRFRAIILIILLSSTIARATSFVCPESDEAQISEAPHELYSVVRVLEERGATDFSVEVAPSYKGMVLESLMVRRVESGEVTFAAALSTNREGSMEVAHLLSVSSNNVSSYDFIISYTERDSRCLLRAKRYTFPLAFNNNRQGDAESALAVSVIHQEELNVYSYV